MPASVNALVNGSVTELQGPLEAINNIDDVEVKAAAAIVFYNDVNEKAEALALLKYTYPAASASIQAVNEKAEALALLKQRAMKIIGDVLDDLGTDRLDLAAGSVVRTAPSIVVRYDVKALEALRLSDEGLKRILDPHRIIDMRPPGRLVIRSKR